MSPVSAFLSDSYLFIYLSIHLFIYLFQCLFNHFIGMNASHLILRKKLQVDAIILGIKTYRINITYIFCLSLTHLHAHKFPVVCYGA